MAATVEEISGLLREAGEDYTAGQPAEPWEAFYAERVLSHFGSLPR